MNNLPPALNNQGPSQNMAQMGPPQMGEEQRQEPQKILAHFTPDELKEAMEIAALFQIPQESLIDPETNLWDLSPLEPIMTDPQFKGMVEQAAQSEAPMKMAEGGEANEPGRPIVPELEELRAEGRGEDTELVIITPALSEVFDEWVGGKTKTNPVTGLPEYGFLKQMLRIAAGVGGFLVGGPVGAGLATAAAHGLTGDNLGGSAKAGLLGFGAGFGANMMGLPGMMGMPGAGTGGFGPSMLGGGQGGTGMLGGMFGGGGGGGNVVGRDTVGRMLPGSAFGGGQGGGGMMGGGGGQGGGGGLLSMLGGPQGLALLGSAGMGFMGNRDENRRQADYERQRREEHDRANSQALSAVRGTPWKKPLPYGLEPLDTPISQEEIMGGRQVQNFRHPPLNEVRYGAKKGGMITGRGKGQDDKIPQNIKENSYIIDASTVSDLGDGSTDAGFKELNSFFGKIPASNQRNAKGGYIKALLSDGEYEVPPEKVAALGGGSQEKGAKMIEHMIKQIRSKKRTSGEKLPPKSKSLGGYLGNIKRA